VSTGVTLGGNGHASNAHSYVECVGEYAAPNKPESPDGVQFLEIIEAARGSDIPVRVRRQTGLRQIGR